MKVIRGRTAFITGAASGIGRAISLRMAQEGAALWITDIDRIGLEATAEQARLCGVAVTARVADLCHGEEIDRLIDSIRVGKIAIDILVNNAGVACYGPTENMRSEDWDRVLAVNLCAPARLTCELLPMLLARPEAHILNVCSIAGLVAMPRLAAYHAAKFGLVGLSEALRAEFGPRGLGVTALCPGLVRTNLFKSAKTCGGKSIPPLPSWLHASADQVACRAIRAIRRREALVVITPLAHFLWRFKRFAPGLLDWMQQFRRHTRKVHATTPMLPMLGDYSTTARRV